MLKRRMPVLCITLIGAIMGPVLSDASFAGVEGPVLSDASFAGVEGPVLSDAAFAGVEGLAARPLAEPAKVAGLWNVTLELGSITGRPTIELKQDGEKLTGTYRGRYGASPLEGAVKENRIGFAVTMNAEGQQTTGYFSGIVEGDKMSGTVEFEGAGEGTWSASRAEVKKGLDVKRRSKVGYILPGVVAR